MQKFTSKFFSRALGCFFATVIFAGNFLPVYASFNVAVNSRNATVHTGRIYCPGNRIVTSFNLAFDASSASFANKPYDVLIDGVKIYSATSSALTTSGYNAYSTSTNPSNYSFPCNGFVTWVASSTSASNLRLVYDEICGGVSQMTPCYIPTNLDDYVSIVISGSGYSSFVPGYILNVYTVPVATTTVFVNVSSGSSSSGTSTTYTVSDTDKPLIFLSLLLCFVVFVCFIIYITKPLYDRE